MRDIKLAVVTFPGNNCETETLRAARRNGFSAEIVRWNQEDRIGNYDAYILPGGFSFEDRVRSGVIASREPIFIRLREEVRKGKVLLGICNGAQMVIESGLIPINNNPYAVGLAQNIRRDCHGKVLGSGYYNTWCRLGVERRDTAFTCKIKTPVLSLPIAHGEGRFCTQDKSVMEVLKDFTALYYADEEGTRASHFPENPNGAIDSIAMLTNKEGNVGAIMPHPERFFKHFDGDLIFQSMYHWIEQQMTPPKVDIPVKKSQPSFAPLKLDPSCLYLEKELIITDNECFSLKSAVEKILGKEVSLKKKIVYEIKTPKSSFPLLSKSGALANLNKETLSIFRPQKTQVFVTPIQDDSAQILSQRLEGILGENLGIRIFKTWEFDDLSPSDEENLLENGIFSNPHAEEIFITHS